MPKSRSTRSYLPTLPVLILLAAGSGGASDAIAATITYTGFVVTDVQLGGHFYHNAAVTLTFRADTKDIRSFSVTTPDSNTGSGSLVDKGKATVQIQAGNVLVQATFASHQVFISLDSENGGVGFSSYIGPNGLEPAYPLGFDDGTAPTNDLVTSANVTGNAWSCIGFPPSQSPTGDCLDPTPYPLKTDHGNFFIYIPYEAYFIDGSIGGYGGSMNRGIFSITPAPRDE